MQTAPLGRRPHGFSTSSTRLVDNGVLTLGAAGRHPVSHGELNSAHTQRDQHSWSLGTFPGRFDDLAHAAQQSLKLGGPGRVGNRQFHCVQVEAEAAEVVDEGVRQAATSRAFDDEAPLLRVLIFVFSGAPRR
jgi:hypothetical protein